MTETKWDKYLRIQTTGRKDSHADEYHYPYEPTPYSVLERLAESGYLNRESHLIDYGCGKGRVGFFLNKQIGCQVTGVEYNEQIYKQAITNVKTFIGGQKKKIEIICIDAECFRVHEGDCFYFFNPFSVELLQSVIGQISNSYYENPREMKLFFYYPNDEYLAYLMTCVELMFVDEIDCQDLFEGENPREHIMIFEFL